MFDWLIIQHPVLQTLLATIFTWSVTALGACFVFVFRKQNRGMLDAMLGFSAGVMTAASFWSLLDPAIKLAEEQSMSAWLVCACGFICGGLLLFTGDKIFDRRLTSDSGSKKRALMLVLSITLHNIPEGLAIGVAFGSAAAYSSGDTAAAIGAWMLALGIGLQNFPEGAAVSVPLRREGFSRRKAFFIGQLSGVVEPVSGIVGALLAIYIRTIMPFMLAFAAGAMIYVVVGELIPESQLSEHKSLIALSTLAGFALMMAMDVGLG